MVILVPAKKLYITFEDMGLHTFILATEIVSNTKTCAIPVSLKTVVKNMQMSWVSKY